MTETLLFVDDEENVLKALERLFRRDDAVVVTASSGNEGLAVLSERPVSVIVSDNLMPGMTGIEFLQRAKTVSPESVHILLTAYADIRSAIDAINKGEVYRFITKPWDDDDLVSVVDDAVRRYHIAASLRRADEATLRSLAQTIELKDPYTRGHCDRVAGYAVTLGERMGLDAAACDCIRYGSWLHDCGKIGVPEAILNFPGPLTAEQMELLKNHSAWGADVAKTAGLHPTVEAIIRYHHERYDGSGYPAGLRGRDIPLEARLVAIADTYDAITSDRPYRKRLEDREAIKIMKRLCGHGLDPGACDIFLAMIQEGGHGREQQD